MDETLCVLVAVIVVLIFCTCLLPRLCASTCNGFLSAPTFVGKSATQITDMCYSYALKQQMACQNSRCVGKPPKDCPRLCPMGKYAPTSVCAEAGRCQNDYFNKLVMPCLSKCSGTSGPARGKCMSACAPDFDTYAKSACNLA